MRRSTYKSYEEGGEVKQVKKEMSFLEKLKSLRWTELSMLNQISIWMLGFFFAYSMLVFIIGSNFSMLFGEQVSEVISKQVQQETRNWGHTVMTSLQAHTNIFIDIQRQLA